MKYLLKGTMYYGFLRGIVVSHEGTIKNDYRFQNKELKLDTRSLLNN